ncbi:MAG: N-acetylmuramoyl-L-alanine amidase [Kiritimatiellia bacterium]
MGRILFLLLLGFSLTGCALFRSSPGEDDGVIIVVDIPLEPEAPAADQPPGPAPDVRVIDHPSPNHDRRTLPVSMIVIHYTAAPLRESLNALCNGRGSNRVSAHYLVAEDGTIYRLVDESRRAWHAGVSRWREITDVNSASIGIEIVNLGHDQKGVARPYPKRQIEAVIDLCLDIQARHDIVDVVGHSDVAPGRKIDPGELFPWKMLGDRGVRIRRPPQ